VEAATTGEPTAKFIPSAIKETLPTPVERTAFVLCRLIPTPLAGAVPVIWMSPATEFTAAFVPLTRTPSLLLLPAPPVPSSVIAPAPAAADVDWMTELLSTRIPNVFPAVPAPRPVKLMFPVPVDVIEHFADTLPAAKRIPVKLPAAVPALFADRATFPSDTEIWAAGKEPDRRMFPRVDTVRFDVPKLDFPWNVTPAPTPSRLIKKSSEYAFASLFANVTPAPAAESVILIEAKAAFPAEVTVSKFVPCPVTLAVSIPLHKPPAVSVNV
jgi:hypothetical protein